MALGDLDLIAVFDGLANARHVGEIELWVNALREQIQAQRDEIDVAGALAVAEQAAFDAVRAGEHTEFGSGDAHALVVVRVEREHHGIAVAQIIGNVLHFVCEHVRRGHLHRRGQIDDHRMPGRRLDHVDHRIAHLHRVLRLGSSERFRRILVVQVDALGVALEFLAQVRGIGGELLDARAVFAEHDLALQHGDGVVEVYNGALATAQAFVSLANEVLTGLREHDDCHVVGNELALDEQANEVVIGLRSAREADFDLLESHVDEHGPEPQLALGIHRVHECLVAVAQIHRAPARRPVQPLARPCALRVVEWHLLVVCHILGVRHIARLLRGANVPCRRQQRVIVPPIGCRGNGSEIKHRRLTLTHLLLLRECKIFRFRDAHTRVNNNHIRASKKGACDSPYFGHPKQGFYKHCIQFAPRCAARHCAALPAAQVCGLWHGLRKVPWNLPFADFSAAHLTEASERQTTKPHCHGTTYGDFRKLCHSGAPLRHISRKLP